MWVEDRARGEPEWGPEEFHEVWWIASKHKEPWAGLRIAHFRKAVDGTLVFFVLGEPPERMGLRVWNDVSKREGWTMIQQIPIPSVW